MNDPIQPIKTQAILDLEAARAAAETHTMADGATRRPWKRPPNAFNPELRFNPEETFERALKGYHTIQFDEFCAMVEAFGYHPDRNCENHYIYFHYFTTRPITIQEERGMVMPFQVRLFLREVETSGLRMRKPDIRAPYVPKQPPELDAKHLKRAADRWHRDNK